MNRKNRSMSTTKTQPLTDYERSLALAVLADTMTALRDGLPTTFQMDAIALIAARGITELVQQTSMFDALNRDALDLLIAAQIAEGFPQEADDDQR